MASYSGRFIAPGVFGRTWIAHASKPKVAVPKIKQGARDSFHYIEVENAITHPTSIDVEVIGEIPAGARHFAFVTSNNPAAERWDASFTVASQSSNYAKCEIRTVGLPPDNDEIHFAGGQHKVVWAWIAFVQLPLACKLEIE